MPVTITENEGVREPSQSGALVIEDDESEPGVLDRISKSALEGVGAVGQFLDSYTGAPTRAAVHELQKDWKNIGGAASAAKKQFGEDPSTAPTGKDIARYAGVPDTSLSDVAPWMYNETGEGLPLKKNGLLDPTASGAAGLGVDIAADPMNLVPGKAVSWAAEKIAPAAGKVGTKIAHALTGVPEGQISTYAKNLPEINKSIKTYGNDIASAADDVRSGYANAIKNARMKLGKTISDTVSVNPSKTIDGTQILNRLESFKSSLNPKLHADDISQIDDLISMAKGVQSETGEIGIQSALDLKELLQERAKKAYQKSGAIFQPGKKSQIASKYAAAETRKLINSAAPEIADANNKLSMLHSLEDRLNKNLIAPGKPEGALLSAGAGTNLRGVKNLENLGELTGTDMLGQAQKLSAQSAFTNPQLLPVDTTGKSGLRVGVGWGLGKLSGIPGAEYVLPALQSPLALKGIINTGSAIGDLAGKYGKGAYYGSTNVGRSQNTGIGAVQPNIKESALLKLQGTKYSQILNMAQQDRGDSGFSATYYILQQSDPEFRRLVKENEGQ